VLQLHPNPSRHCTTNPPGEKRKNPEIQKLKKKKSIDGNNSLQQQKNPEIEDRS
jgi:hypothetical protein